MDSLSIVWDRGFVFMLQLLPVYNRVLSGFELSLWSRLRLLLAFFSAGLRRVVQRVAEKLRIVKAPAISRSATPKT